MTDQAAQPEVSLVDRISSEYYNLTAREKIAADYVIGHRAESQTMSITELSDACGVAEATLSRFVRRLGYPGYSDFKIDLIRSISTSDQELSPLSGEIGSRDSFSDVCRKLYASDVDAITQTMNLLDESEICRAADIIIAAQKVFCMGQGGSMILAEEAAHLFTTSGCKYFSVSDNHTQAITAATMDKTDALLYFSYSGATTDMMHTLAIVKSRGAKVILITRFPNSPGARYADVILKCGAQESPLQLGSVPAKISQLFLMDVLFSEVCRRDLDECRRARSRIADVLADKHL